MGEPHLQRYLDDHPDLESIDLLMPDLNGLARGKQIGRSLFAKSFREGILLPRSVYGGNICGETVEATDLGIRTGDQDQPCLLEAATLRPVPWANRSTAQCMMEMHGTDGTPFPASPRQVLRNIVKRLHDDGLYPTVAVELEFYLFRDALDDTGRPLLLIDPVTGREANSTQVYSMDELALAAPFIDTVQRYCQAQGVPASAAVAEYAPCQFEINLAHRSDPLAACDDALYLKRIVRQAARNNQALASFMAKPLAGQTGCGMHIHVSLFDEQGNNRFSARDGELGQAIGGLQATINEAMLLYAPHGNSYRRFRPKAYVPLSPTWGYNNRTVAMRIPAGPEKARRIEHRVAGADANPHLVMAAVLAGIHHGYRNSLATDEPIEGDAAGQREPTLPTDWRRAIDLFDDSMWIRDYFGHEFQSLYGTIKLDEYEDYQREVTPLDIRWYLQTV